MHLTPVWSGGVPRQALRTLGQRYQAGQPAQASPGGSNNSSSDLSGYVGLRQRQLLRRLPGSSDADDGIDGRGSDTITTQKPAS